MLIDHASRQRGQAQQRAFRDRMSSYAALKTPSLNPDVSGSIFDFAGAIDLSRPLVRARFRKAIKMTTFAAIGSTFAWIALLDARGELHGKEIHHQARIAEVSTIHAVLSFEETLGLKSPPPTPMQVVALDAPWTPVPDGTKPWTPAPAESPSIVNSEQARNP